MTKEYIYLISPVRAVTPEQSQLIDSHEKKLEESHERIIFNPIRDAPQEDRTGYNIVMSELNFMHLASKNGGRADVLWNRGGIPSEGSRVDLGIAYALGLEINLVEVFNEDKPTGPQMAFMLIDKKNHSIKNNILKDSIDAALYKMETAKEAIINWETWDGLNATEDQEWQRIYLGLALGCLVKDPGFKIRMGQMVGYDPPEIKSYPKVIKEIENKI